VRRPLTWVVTAGLSACLIGASAPAALALPRLPTVDPLPCVDAAAGALGQYQEVRICPPPIG